MYLNEGDKFIKNIKVHKEYREYIRQNVRDHSS